MIVAGQRELVAAWVASRVRDMGTPPERDYEAIGVAKDGKLIGGVIYAEWRELSPGEHDIRMVAAGEPGWFTKKTLREIFGYHFLQLNCVRVTAVVGKANKTSRDMMRRLGYTEEGCLRNGLGKGRDLILYGMLRSECRWIGETDGKEIRPQAA